LPQEPLTEIEGIVAGGVDYGEADRIIHLITPSGRASAFAHGARKSKRRFAGALEMFASVRASIAGRRQRDGMPTVSSAVVLDARLGIRADLGRIALATYAVEVVSIVAPEGQASEGVYRLAAELLDRLAQNPASVAQRRAFELKLYAELGYHPELDACTVCGEHAEPAFLDLLRGGIVCASHRERAKEIGPVTLDWIRRALLGPLTMTDFDPEAADRAARAIRGPMADAIGSLVGRPLKSVALLDDVKL
jgi:DNA repair protein RecO (recombination protein O)